MPRASTMPMATHTSAAPPLAHAGGGAGVVWAGVGVGSGEVPWPKGVGRGDRLSGIVPRTQSAAAAMNTTASASSNHKREWREWAMAQL